VALHTALQPQGLQTLAVAMQSDPPAAVALFAEHRRLPFGVLIDNTGAVAHGFGDVAVTPTSIVLDHQGRIVLRVVGKLADGTLHSVLSRLLAAPATAHPAA
jgi:peroxiredoxin